MYTVRCNSDKRSFETLHLAMEHAKMLGVFVTIEGNGMEIVGVFGADAVVDGKTPDGVEYSWMKRRKQ